MSENNDDKNICFEKFIESQVSIPLIQREYAQGRDDTQGEEVRKNFVPELIKVLTSKEQSLELDFVFGVKEENVFIPLDGQQRLTTLLLLHWYFGAHKGKNWSFTYESRRMANSFVKGLLAEQSYDKNRTPSEWIKKRNWFFEIWLSDPTVSGMLTMLDTIHENTQKKTCKNENLANITFYLYPIEHLGADNAYTKMNARGEPLTEWENIKALLDKKAQIFCFTENTALCLHKTCSLSQWLENIDGEWLFKLEEYAELKTDNLSNNDKKLESAIKKINCAFRNIFDLAVCIDLAWQINKEKEGKICSDNNEEKAESKKEKEERITLLQKKVSNFHSHKALLSDYQTYVTRRTFEIATDLFNALCNCQKQTVFKQGWTKDRSLNCLWKSSDFDANIDFTKDFLFNENANYENFIRFFALSLYNDNTQVLRVILNLLDNSGNIDNENFDQVVIGISELISNRDLVEVLESLTFFNSKQIEEEIKKVKKYKKEDKSWLEFENHPLLYGSIGFLWDGENFSIERYKFFDKTFTSNKTWRPDRFYELLKYYDKKLNDAVDVPNEDAKKWRKLFKQQDARNAFVRMATKNEQSVPQWIEFFINHKDEVNNHRLAFHDSNVYDYNTENKISSNAVRLSYIPDELKLLEIINPPYLCYGQSEAKIDLTKCNCNWNENITDSQKQTAKIKLQEFGKRSSEQTLSVYDDKDKVIGSLTLKVDNVEKS